MKVVALAVPLALALSLTAQPCPIEAPEPMGIAIVPEGYTGSAFPDGTPIPFKLVPFPHGFFPPAVPSDGYTIQNCDEVKWNFGDGTPELVVNGSNAAMHTFPSPGNYAVNVTVTNSLGSSTVTRGFVVASNAAEISWPRLPDVSETAASVTIPVTRTGDTTRTVSATLRVFQDPDELAPALHADAIPVVFAPGETLKNVTLPLFDNKLYDGRRWAYVELVAPTGGVTLEHGGFFITDNEPRPTLHAESMSIYEGNVGARRVKVPVHLTGPLGAPWTVDGLLASQTAEGGIDFHWGLWRTRIPAGETSATIEVQIFGDVVTEPDEAFLLKLWTDIGIPREPLAGAPATIRIMNDDAGITPHRQQAYVGEDLWFTYYPAKTR